MQANKIICGSAKEVLKTLPAESVNCCISSPPYWSLRDYGTATWEGGDSNCDHQTARSSGDDLKDSKQSTNVGSRPNLQFICAKCGARRIDKQLGLEPTFEEYIDKLCAIYDEVKRVLRKDGTCWVNLGDTYANNPSNQQGKGVERSNVGLREGARSLGRQNRSIKTVPTKSLCLIPQRFAIEMVNRGWILRNVIIWHKPNPMPSSTKDRFTVDFEYIYFFVKNNQNLWCFQPDGKISDKQPDYKNGIEGLDWQWGMRKGKKVKKSLWQGFKYWFETQYEPHSRDWTNCGGNIAGSGLHKRGNGYSDPTDSHPNPCVPNPLGRNKRTVWTIPTQSFSEAHFATFPEKLIEPIILAGCPEFICTKCGKARVKTYKKGEMIAQRKQDAQYAKNALGKDLRTVRDKGWNTESIFCPGMQYKQEFKGYTDCGCGEKFRPGIVLDPFMGSGTTCLVAAQNRRDYIGIELKPEYIEMANKRISAVETGVPVKEQRQGQKGLFE